MDVLVDETTVSDETAISGATRDLAFTRYCYYQYCMAYGIHTGGRRGGPILLNSRAIVLHQGGQCRWARGMKRWLIRAQKPRSERISGKGYDATRCLLSKEPLPRRVAALGAE